MRIAVVALAGLGLTSAVAQAQYSSDFEPPAYAGSAAGTLLTNGFGGGGQNGWYNPVAGSVDFNVHTHAANSLGFPANPNGGEQFIGARGTAAPNNIGRAQHATDFSSTNLWTASWDVIGGYRGTSGTAVDNLGSWSLQPSGTANFFQQIMQWGTNTTAPIQYNINYGVFGAAGGAAPAFQSPGAAWVNVPVDHWIRQSTTWDFGSNQILSVSIQDLTAGGAVTTVDTSTFGWYLAGGQNNVLGKARPTDIRCFTGNADNATGWDNIVVTPAPGGVLAFAGGLVLTLSRRRR